MKIEYWRPIPGYEGLYEVSSLGRVKSLPRFMDNRHGGKSLLKGRIMKLTPDTCGYLRVRLCKNCIQKSFKVHRLVALAFIPNPLNLPQINHRNELKDDNRVENLEWCDASYNNSYGTLPKRQSDSQINDILKSKSVYQYTLEGVLVHVWPSVNETRRYGFSLGHVAACCRGERKTHKGFLWFYTPIIPF